MVSCGHCISTSENNLEEIPADTFSGILHRELDHNPSWWVLWSTGQQPHSDVHVSIRRELQAVAEKVHQDPPDPAFLELQQPALLPEPNVDNGLDMGRWLRARWMVRALATVILVWWRVDAADE